MLHYFSFNHIIFFGTFSNEYVYTMSFNTLEFCKGGGGGRIWHICVDMDYS